MDFISIPFTEYHKSLYNFSLLGDLLVFGLTIIEAPNNDVKIDQDLIKSCLSYMIKRHPLLRAHLEIDGKNISFKITDEPYKYEITEKESEWIVLNDRSELEEKLEKFNNRSFDYETKCRLWRSSVYDFHENCKQKYAIALLLPLFMTDALNITSLSIEIVNILNSLVLNRECHEMTEKLDPVDNMFSLVEKNHLISDQQLENIQKINQNQKCCFKFDKKFKTNSEKGTKINIFRLNEAISKKLISISKEKQIKLTGLLMVSLFYSIKDWYKENNLLVPKNIRFGVSSNLRFRLEPKVDFSSIGYFSTLMGIDLEYPNFGKYENIWKDSKYVDELIGEMSRVDTGAIFADSHNYQATKEVNNLFETIADKKEICKILNSNSKWDIIASNIGTYLCKNKTQNPLGPFKIEEVYFTDSLNSEPAIDSSLLLHITYWNDQLMFMISSNKSSIDSQKIIRLVDLYENFLISIAENI